MPIHVPNGMLNSDNIQTINDDILAQGFLKIKPIPDIIPGKEKNIKLLPRYLAIVSKIAWVVESFTKSAIIGTPMLKLKPISKNIPE